MKLVDVDRTLIRYLHDNIPIESFDLQIAIENQESASLAEKWIGPVASKTSLKEFSLMVLLMGGSFTLPDEILSGENITKLRVTSPSYDLSMGCLTRMKTPVLKCVFLRELHLDRVSISKKALHDILSSCSLLETIELLHCCNGFKSIKVKNFPRLRVLRISLDDDRCSYATALEISDVPNLDIFSYNLHVSGAQMPIIPFNAHSISLGSNVTELELGGVILDNECLDKIQSGFPFLRILTLRLSSWKLGSFHFTCVSVRNLSLLLCPHSLIDVQVHAPKLLFFRLVACTMPSLLFPVSSLRKITVSLILEDPVDANFFLKTSEALTLTRNYHLHLMTKLPFNIDMDDLKTRLLLPPATNMQEVWFETRGDECVWERSLFFDAFFQICHPKRVFARPDAIFRDNNHFCRLMLKEVLDQETTTATATAYWPHYLKRVQIRHHSYDDWKTLTNSHRSFLDGSTPRVHMHFNLKWH
ncbi:hypothetical protein L1887_07977 [Cichorium endivia]|nr:hypothetical protein L1887_07977 [Cichorium endivia]